MIDYYCGEISLLLLVNVRFLANTIEMLFLRLLNLISFYFKRIVQLFYELPHKTFLFPGLCIDRLRLNQKSCQQSKISTILLCHLFKGAHVLHDIFSRSPV